MNTKPVYLTAEGLAEAQGGASGARHRRPAARRGTHPRGEARRRPLRERRVRGRQAGAVVPGGPHRHARAAAAQRRCHREGQRRQRRDRLEGRHQGPRRRGDLHHRRIGGGRSARRPDQQRVAGRRRPDGPQEGRQGGGPGPVRPDRVHPRPHRLTTVFWADEIAASSVGPQVVNDSKTPSGTVHVGSLRGPVVVDTIVRALRDAEVPVELRYGVDDLDPDGRPGAPDAGCHRALHGRAALARPGSGRRLPPVVRAPLRRRSSSTPSTAWASGPTRYYWMSEIYGSGAMDRYIRTALDARRDDPRDLRPRGERPPSRRLASALRDLRELRPHRHHHRHRLGRRARRTTSAAPTW